MKKLICTMLALMTALLLALPALAAMLSPRSVSARMLVVVLGAARLRGGSCFCGGWPRSFSIICAAREIMGNSSFRLRGAADVYRLIYPFYTIRRRIPDNLSGSP